MTSLQDLMKEQLPKGGVSIPGARDPHMEILDTSTGWVWMSVEVAMREDYEAFAEGLGAPYRGMGIGAVAMDAAQFNCSPGGEGEPVRERIINGWRFINVAIPGELVSLPGGMVEVMVDKHHVLGFEAGRTLVVLSLPEGDYVEVVGDPELDEQLTLPEGGSLGTISLRESWVVSLPTPTRTLWRMGKGIPRSFQGPVTLPEPLSSSSPA